MRCVFLMVVVPMLPHSEFGRNDLREYALHFIIWVENLKIPRIQPIEIFLKKSLRQSMFDIPLQEALDKYNIQLPVFSKIGGLLASEISIDEASLHAAILAINKALDTNDFTDLEEKIQNPDAHLGISS